MGGSPRDLASAMVRYGQWKLVEYSGFEHPQLFELGHDPHEQNDLGTDPRYQGLRTQMSKWLHETWDNQTLADQFDRDSRGARLIRQFHAEQPVPAPDQWRGREQDNFIEPWPDDEALPRQGEAKAAK
jgi:hypothetical protein